MLFSKKKRKIKKILIVEDEPLVAFDTEHMLGDAGFEIVRTVDRVADAVATIGEGIEIDLVLVDVNLADGSGIDVARTAHARSIPALFVTGACPTEAREVAAGCLAKPYSHRDLRAAIDAIDRVMAGNKLGKLPNNFSLFLETA